MKPSNSPDFITIFGDLPSLRSTIESFQGTPAINQLDARGNTWLTYALIRDNFGKQRLPDLPYEAKIKRLDIIEWLADAGVDFNVATEYGGDERPVPVRYPNQTPLDFCFKLSEYCSSNPLKNGHRHRAQELADLMYFAERRDPPVVLRFAIPQYQELLDSIDLEAADPADLLRVRAIQSVDHQRIALAFKQYTKSNDAFNILIDEYTWRRTPGNETNTQHAAFAFMGTGIGGLLVSVAHSISTAFSSAYQPLQPADSPGPQADTPA